MSASVTLKGNPVELCGPNLTVGADAPDFTANKSLVETACLGDFAGKTVLISCVPSLDTPVCDVQSKRFNEEAAKLDGVEVITISVDLPPAQARWCGASGADKMTLLSDYKDRDFGHKYGTYIPSLGICCRAVFVIGPDGKIKHAEYVSEVAEHPDYDAALAAAKG